MSPARLPPTLPPPYQPQTPHPLQTLALLPLWLAPAILLRLILQPR